VVAKDYSHLYYKAAKNNNASSSDHQILYNSELDKYKYRYEKEKEEKEKQRENLLAYHNNYHAQNSQNYGDELNSREEIPYSK
jgi:hypothetical protein